MAVPQATERALKQAAVTLSKEPPLIGLRAGRGCEFTVTPDHDRPWRLP